MDSLLLIDDDVQLCGLLSKLTIRGLSRLMCCRAIFPRCCHVARAEYSTEMRRVVEPLIQCDFCYRSAALGGIGQGFRALFQPAALNIPGKRPVALIEEMVKIPRRDIKGSRNLRRCEIGIIQMRL